MLINKLTTKKLISRSWPLGSPVQGGHREDGERGGEIRGGGRDRQGQDRRQELLRVLHLQRQEHARRRETQGGGSHDGWSDNHSKSNNISSLVILIKKR